MLPKIEYPVFKIFIPITKKELSFRVMTLKEEKIILTAQENKNIIDLMDAMLICIQNCSINNKVDFTKLPFFELQLIYLNLRSNSIGAISKLLIPDDYEKLFKHEVSVNIENINLNMDNLMEENIIKFTEQSGMIMKYPDFYTTRKINKITNETDKVISFIRSCIKSIFDATNVYNEDSFSEEELEKYIDELPSFYFNLLKNFIDNIPKIEYIIEYKNSKEEPKRLVLNNLENFT